MTKYIFTLSFIYLFATSAAAQLFPDRHTTNPSDGWKSCQESMNPNEEIGMSHWIMFDFNTPQAITEVKIWNHNDPVNLEDGVANIRIDYSLDNINWTSAGEFAVTQSEGSAFYEGEIIGNLNGISMRYMVITALDNHGGTCYGFDETRFYLGQAVPIVLVDFQGSCEKGEKKITWNYSDITDFGSVELEWSTNGQNWESIYTSNNPGKKVGFQDYENEFSDIRKVPGDKHFYRLKMIDQNGNSQNSDIISIACEVDENDIQIYPQPVSTEMNIDVELIDDAEIVYSVKNVLGQNIMEGVFEAKTGFNRFILDASQMISGQYFLLMDINGQQVEKKFLKQ